ncbi:EamA family transporter RarD [Alkalihalobacillus sp. LMS39]|uniref:EamA family transporter RarD n=1 Tax=Alkalihalobacillus sp. LMS39 TaxID=2924032 RepID=UPI001FB37BBE|nr:EamA family transporter RarD [Alkalihalobacillus sp. LMS39]UOE92581.1 EamA family transporter RarD [Alkalihalobacillus sp. LMS39]
MKNEQQLGISYAIGAYLLWGLLPLYWKLIDTVPADVVLAHRIIWSFVLMTVILFCLHKFKPFLVELKTIMTSPKQLLGLLLATIFISANWYTYIWAVGNDLVIETSLGYYMNPLVSVLLGIIFLKERLSIWQMIALILACLGVMNMVFNVGHVPWAALMLAFSFAFYGLLKKVVNVGALTGLTIETLLLLPFALLYVQFFKANVTVFSSGLSVEMVLLIGAGVATAVPLLLFASGARRIPLFMIGFLQYIAPTITLILGVFIFQEPFTKVHLISFMLIWSALVLFSVAKTKSFMYLETKYFTKKKSFEG